MIARKIASPVFLATIALSTATAGVAHAQHAHGDILIGSDSDGGGRLVLDYPFEEVSVVPVTASGFPGVFTSTDPGFVPAEDEPLEGVFALDIPTTVGIEIMGIDDNLEVQLGMSTLSAAGDAAVIGTHDNVDPELSGLHQHPQFLLSLHAGSTGEFAEGEFWFRAYDPGAGYTESEVRKLEVSNGYLPPIESPTTTAMSCRKAVAKAGRTISTDVYKRVGACFDKALEAVAAADPAKALSACNLNPLTEKSLAHRLDASHAKGVAGAAKACGPLTDASEPFTGSAVAAHLAMASCRAQEVVGATYGEARAALEEVLATGGGDGSCSAETCGAGVLAGVSCTVDEDCTVEHAIDTALPCLKTAAGHEEE